jgi:hypothetical protein
VTDYVSLCVSHDVCSQGGMFMVVCSGTMPSSTLTPRGPCMPSTSRQTPQRCQIPTPSVCERTAQRAESSKTTSRRCRPRCGQTNACVSGYCGVNVRKQQDENSMWVIREAGDRRKACNSSESWRYLYLVL